MEETRGNEGGGGGGGGEKVVSMATTLPPRISLIPNESFGLDEDATEREKEGDGEAGQMNDDVNDDVTPSLRASIISLPPR